MENETKKKKTTSTKSTKKATATKKVNSTAKTGAKKASTTKKTTTASATKSAPKTASATSNKNVASKKNQKGKKSTSVPAKKIVEEVKVTTEEVVPTKDIKDKKEKKVKKVKEVKEVKEAKEVKPEVKKEKMVLEKNEFTNLIKIIIIVTAVFLAFYLITYLINKNKDTTKKEDTTEVTIQYDEILLSNVLKQKNDEYYVLAYDAEDKYFDAYNTYLTSYKSGEDALRVYTSIISNGFNKKYYDVKEEKSNTKVSNVDDLKLNKSTLLKVKDGKVTDSYEGNEAIISELKSMID